MSLLAPYDNPAARWFTPPDAANTAKLAAVVAGPVVQLDQAGWDTLSKRFEESRQQRSAWEEARSALVMGGSLLMAGFTGNPAPLIAAAAYTAGEAAVNAHTLPGVQTAGLTSSSFSTPLGQVMGIPTESTTGEFFPFGYEDSAFLASAAAAADANSPRPSLNTDAIVLPIALLLLGLAWWYVRKP